MKEALKRELFCSYHSSEPAQPARARKRILILTGEDTLHMGIYLLHLRKEELSSLRNSAPTTSYSQ